MDQGQHAAAFGLLSHADADRAVRIRPTEFLEGPSEIAMMYRRHGGAITSAGDALDEALTALLIDLIGEVYRVPNGRTVPGHVLREHGFDPDVPEPDPFDYW